MKFTYAVTYCQLKPEHDNKSADEVAKLFEKHGKAAEKHGIKMVFWGSPWGCPEGLCVCYHFDDVSKYEKFMGSGEREVPFEKARTNLMYTW